MSESFVVLMSPAAIQDLHDLYEWIDTNDGRQRARQFIEHLEAKIDSLAEHPFRGVLVDGIFPYKVGNIRQIFYLSYRILYQINDNAVSILLVADGRRNLQALLHQRIQSSS